MTLPALDADNLAIGRQRDERFDILRRPTSAFLLDRGAAAFSSAQGHGEAPNIPDSAPRCASASKDRAPTRLWGAIASESIIVRQ
jgi:hypothetical protein